jgi:Flp pilus assembly protein TadD
MNHRIAPLAAVALLLAAPISTLAAGPVAGDYERTARAALARGDAQDAGLALKLAIQEDPLDSKSNFLLACLLAQRGEHDQAMIGFRRALGRDPSHPAALHNLATLLLERRLALEAARLFEAAVSLRPEYVPSYNGLAKAYFMVGLPQLAETTYREALARDPSNPVARSNLLLLAQAPGDEAGASGEEAPPPERPASGPPSPASAPPPKPPAGTGPLSAHSLRELLRDLPHVNLEQRAGHLAITGWTRSGHERTQLDRILAEAPSVLDLTSDDASDSQRMLEVDAVLFIVIGIDSESLGFDFLRLVSVTSTYFLSNDAAGLVGLAAPGTTGGAITLPSNGWVFNASVDYDVNIANAANERVAVLARPHLTTLSGTPASFLAGGEIVFRVSGLENGDIKPYPFGTSLTVTPTLLRAADENSSPRVHLAVDVERTSVLEVQTSTQQDQSVLFDKVNVSGESILELDQTLILSGVSQRESRTIFSGVPILRSIPGLRYFFSNRTEVETNTAVLILLTPRDPYFVDEQTRRARAEFVQMREAFVAARLAGPGAMERFRTRYPDWRRPPPNHFASHFFLARTSEIYRTVSGEDLVDDRLDLDLLGDVMKEGRRRNP